MKKNIIILTIFIILFISGCTSYNSTKVSLEEKQEITQTQEKEENTIKIGVAAMISPKDSLYAYENIVEYIGNKVGKKAVMVFSKDYAKMSEMVKNQEVDAAFVCSGPYVRGHDEWGMEIIAAPVIDNKSVYYSYIIVHKDSKITSFKELKGKKFAFTDPESNTGSLVPRYQLALIGETPQSYFSELIFTGSHDKSIITVAQKVVDGAAVDHLIWEYMNKKNNSFTTQTKYIEKLGPYCIPPFTTHPNTDPELKAKLTDALLNMHKDEAGKKILKDVYIDKFIKLNDSCYDSVREMEDWINKIKKE